jgi:hypothetical protein
MGMPARALDAGLPAATELAYYLCCGPENTTDEELVRVAAPGGPSENVSWFT